MKFNVPTQEELSKFQTDCPECEYCCIIGLCCPPERQFLALVALMVRSSSTIEAAAPNAQAIVDARVRMGGHA